MNDPSTADADTVTDDVVDAIPLTIFKAELQTKDGSTFFASGSFPRGSGDEVQNMQTIIREKHWPQGEVCFTIDYAFVGWQFDGVEKLPWWWDYVE